MEDDDEGVETRRNGGVGHRRPPVSTRFPKGQSGNPHGRPRGSRRQPPYEAVLGQLVTIRDGSRERRVTAAEAFLLQLAKRGLEGDGAAARATMDAIEDAVSAGALDDCLPTTIVRNIVYPGSVNGALEPLRIARKLDPYRPTARMMIEPWIVEEALARLGERRMSRDEQEIILKAARTPDKVKWPAWWEKDLRGKR